MKSSGLKYPYWSNLITKCSDKKATSNRDNAIKFDVHKFQNKQTNLCHKEISSPWEDSDSGSKY